MYRAVIFASSDASYQPAAHSGIEIAGLQDLEQCVDLGKAKYASLPPSILSKPLVRVVCLDSGGAIKREADVYGPPGYPKLREVRAWQNPTTLAWHE